MADSSLRNAWVDKYLEALLGDGLSKEYVNRVDDGEEEVQGYGTLAANYWINLIFDDEQENIVASWRKAKVCFPSFCASVCWPRDDDRAISYCDNPVAPRYRPASV
jgi:hypothetical protein